MNHIDTLPDRRQVFEDEALPHLPALYRTARRLTMNSEEAQDLVQETFLRAYRSFDHYQPGTNCRAWLFRILTNLQINRYQKQRRRPGQLSLDDTEEFYLYQQSSQPEQYQDGADPQRVFLESMVDEEVKGAVAALPADFRIAVILSDIEGFSYQEIADIMDTPVGTVRSRIHRGRRLLQKQLWNYAVEQMGWKFPSADGNPSAGGRPALSAKRKDQAGVE